MEVNLMVTMTMPLKEKNGPSSLNGRRYYEEQGYLNIWLPNGHLRYKEGENVGGVNIWEHTGLNYPEMGVNVYRMNALRNIGYNDPNVESVVISVVRPHDIPKAIKNEGGIGVSGRDWTIEKLEIPAINGESEDDNFFSENLNEEDLVYVMKLGFRPCSLVFAHPKEFGIRNYCDMKRYYEGHFSSDGAVVVATEYPFIAKQAMIKKVGLTEADARDEEKIIYSPKAGQTETWAHRGTAILDVAETGRSLRKHGLRPVFPVVMNSSPDLIARQTTADSFPDFLNELKGRLEEGAERTRKKYPRFFRNKLNEEYFRRL